MPAIAVHVHVHVVSNPSHLALTSHSHLAMPAVLFHLPVLREGMNFLGFLVRCVPLSV